MNCPTCKSVFETPVETCPKCGFPFNGTESEKSSFIAQQIIKVGQIEDARKSVTSARYILFVIGAVNIVLSVLSKDPSVLVVGLLIGVGFFVFGLIVKKSPFLFLSIALGVLLLFYISDAIVDPSNIARGLILKVVYVTALSYGIIRVKRAEKFMNETEFLRSK